MKIVSKLSRSLRLLQWKLTWSYTLTTVLVLVSIEIIFMIILATFFLTNSTAGLSRSVGYDASGEISNFSLATSNRARLEQWLDTNSSASQVGDVSYEGYRVIIDMQGKIVGARGTAAPVVGTILYTQLSSKTTAQIHAILKSSPALYTVTEGISPLPSATSIQENPDTVVLIAPIVNAQKQIEGAFIVKASKIQYQLQSFFSALLFFVLGSLLVFTICAGLIGTIFGFFTARSFVRRFKALSHTVDNWSQGNFSTFAQDKSVDEIGQLAQRLNRMAEQLQQFVQMRQELATLEERHRLARELHDSVKQQMFAISLQVDTAKAVFRKDSNGALARLDTIDTLVKQAQQELSTLIGELRPTALVGKGLPTALQEYLTHWQQQTGIQAVVRIEGEEPIPSNVEEAFYRIVQEALSNVIRHSHASFVQILLISKREAVTLSLRDNGYGFDLAARKGKGVGLLSMQERLSTLGGSVRIISHPGQGTTIIAHCEQSPVGVK